MYELLNLDANCQKMLNKIEQNDIYVCGMNTFNSINAYKQYPIKNRNIAIRNMLKFLRFIDLNMTEDQTLLTIPAKEIRAIFSGAQYRAYIDILAKLQIITRVPYNDGKFYDYKKEKRYCQYRVHSSYMSDKVGLVYAPKEKALKFTTDKKYPAKFEKTIRYAKCDYSKAIQAEYENYIEQGMKENRFRIRLSRLFALNYSRFIKKGKKVDRIYSSFSNLSKICRKYLSIEGSIFYEIDVRNCQPLLLCYLLKKQNMSLDDNYITDCETACIYERFIDKKHDRNKVKDLLYKSIYFDLKPQRKIAQKFKELYPQTYDSLLALNSDQETLASKLQNIEASIFNKLKPHKSKYYFTLFDGIFYTDKADTGELIKQCVNLFMEFGLTPKFK